MRVASYIRVSTDEQAQFGVSLDEQKESTEKWCKDHGYPPPVHYIDDGYSSYTTRRPAYKRMVDDVEKGKYDIVITLKLDRFFRNLLEQLKCIDFLDRREVKFFSVTEDLDFLTAAGKLNFQVLAGVAEFQRNRISEDVRRNMISIANKAGVTKKAFTVPCYGYDAVEGKYQINEQEAQAVRLMASWVISGLGCRAVAIRLNNPPYSVRTRTGRSWSEAFVRQLMRKETLMGTLVYNRTYKRNGKTLYRPEEEWIVIEEHHPTVLDEQTWNDLQRALDGRKKAGKQSDNEKWLLSGLLICTHCGGKMKGASLTKLKYPEYALHKYICSTYHRGAGCFSHHANRDGLESFVLQQLTVAATTASAKQLQLAAAEPKGTAAEKENLSNRLERLDAKMQKQIEAYEDDLISAADLKKAGERVEDERKSIEKKLKELVQDPVMVDNSSITDNIKRHYNDLISGDRLTVKNGIRQTVQRIELTNGKDIRIVYHS